MKVLIRQVKFTDINQMIKLNENTLPENYPKEFWVSKFHEGKENSFVAICSEAVVGYILCDKESIISFSIEEKFRGKGVGRQLLQHCLNTLNEKVELHVRVTNSNAIKLYKSVGFTGVGEMKDYYINPIENGYLMDWIPQKVSSGYEFSQRRKFIEVKKLNLK